MLRTVFSNEFALPTNMSESELISEWEETIQSITKEKLTQHSSNNQLSINNDRLHSILCNLITPFVASLYTICKSLLQVNKIHSQNFSSKICLIHLLLTVTKKIIFYL